MSEQNSDSIETTETTTPEATSEITEPQKTEASEPEKAAEAEPAPEAEAKPEDAQEGEKDGDEKEAEGAPEAYDLKPPTGFEELDAAGMEKAGPLFKELGLSNEQAQRLVNLYGEMVQGATGAVMEQASAETEKRVQEGEKALEAYAKSAGYSDFKSGATDHEMVKTAQAGALWAFDGDKSAVAEVFQTLDQLGLSARMIPAFHHVGKALEADKFARGGNTDPMAGLSQVQRWERQMYD